MWFSGGHSPPLPPFVKEKNLPLLKQDITKAYIDSRYANFSYEIGSQSFRLSDTITKPEGFYCKEHMLSAWIPMTYYNVFTENNRLDIEHNP